MNTVTQQFLKLLCAILLITPLFTTAQVGVGTTTPAATTDITALNPTGTATNVDGLLIPRVDRRRARLMASIPTSTLIYVNNLNSSTAAPATNIDAVGFYYFDGTLWQKMSSSNTDWSLTGNTGTTAGTNFIGTTDTKDFVVKTDNSERIRVASNGRVGIAENNPSDATLEVGGNLIVGNTFTGGNAVAQTGGATIEGRTIIGEDDFFYDVDKLVVYGNTTWVPGAVTNGDNGNNLIYAINGYTSDGVGLYAEDNDGGDGLQTYVYSSTSANRPKGVYGFDGSGYGYGVYGLSSYDSGTDGYRGVYGREYSGNGYAVYASGDLYVSGTIYNPSDKRLKKNIAPINNALSIIDQITPKTYDYRWDEDKFSKAGLAKTNQMGFIAQELEQVLPNLIKETKLTLSMPEYTKEELQKNPQLRKEEEVTMNTKAINYTALIPLLTQAIKEQQEIIKALEIRIEKLEK